MAGRKERQQHWQQVYSQKQATEVSWYQDRPVLSLQLIMDSVCEQAAVIDVGGGASKLVDYLIEAGFRDLTVLDIAQAALSQARQRLGDKAARVQWIEADITRWRPERQYEVWHDRAVFHFLTDPDDRAAYRAALMAAVKPGGSVIIATFSPQGPQQCSGLPVVRYSPQALNEELGGAFSLLDSFTEEHHTPTGFLQHFQFSRLRRSGL